MISRTALILSTLAFCTLATQDANAGCSRCKKAKKVRVVKRNSKGRAVKVATVQVCTDGTCPLVRK